MSTQPRPYGAPDHAALAAKFISSTNRNIFLTGKAGTGKTTFLKQLKEATYKNICVVAPTGIAAINAGGMTIHSMFQLPPIGFIPNYDQSALPDDSKKFNNALSLLRQQRLGKDKLKVIRHMELLVIDEVSMLRADTLDAIDTVLKSVRRAHNRPFGGVQVLFIGDLLQLPPVVKDDEWAVLSKYYPSPFFFDAQVLRDVPPLTIELSRIYRQSDDTFISVLNNLRNNTVTTKDAELLNRYYKPGYYGIPQDKYIQLTTHNHKADSINKSALHKLKTKTETFKAEIEDEFPEKMFPADEMLELKEGAQIMFLVNDPDKRYFNGKIGKLLGFSANREQMLVQFDGEDKQHWIEKYTWQNIEYTAGKGGSVFPESIGTFTQFPVKLAWAITVHKSQGLTFPRAILDLEQAFAPGQVYVALSRLTSLEGLILSSKLNFSSLRLDQTVQLYDAKKESPEKLNTILDEESKYYVQDYVSSRFDLKPLMETLMRYIEDTTGDAGARSLRARYRSWARSLANELQPAEDTASRFVAQVKRIGDNWPAMLERAGAAKKYFEPLLRETLNSIERHVSEVSKEKRVKSYLKDLGELSDAINNQLHLYARAETLLRAVIANSVPQRSDLYVAEEYPRLTPKDDEDETKSLRNRPRSGAFRGVSTSRKTKGDSAKITLEMYRRGMSVAEIATDRGLTSGTIMSHFVELIAEGLCRPEDFIQYERLETIRLAIQQLQTTQLIPLREHLGEEYSFEELRMVVTGVKRAEA